jgi:hypothetical protein
MSPNGSTMAEFEKSFISAVLADLADVETMAYADAPILQHEPFVHWL